MDAAYNPTPVSLLLDGVQRSTYLFGWSEPNYNSRQNSRLLRWEAKEPTQKGRMKAIDIRHQNRRGHHEKQEVPEEQI